jgi:hypothetical protein
LAKNPLIGKKIRQIFGKDQLVDARQRNERDARMGAEETGLEQVDSSAEFCCFY